MSMELGEVDADLMLAPNPPPDINNVLSKDETREVDTEEEPGEVDTVGTDEIRPPPVFLSARGIEFSKGPPATEIATTLPDKCFFPPAIDAALHPDTDAKEEPEPKRPKVIDNQSIDIAIGQFRKLRLYQGWSRRRNNPASKLKELGFDFGTREVGKPFDIFRLLSHLPNKAEGEQALLVCNGNDGETVTVTVENALRSKRYILICCVGVPILNSNASHLRGISSATIELKELHGDDMFQTVIVAHMIPGWEDNKAAFNRFFAAFPGCVAVPFEDKNRRDFICTVLNLYVRAPFATSILVDSVNHEVLIGDDATYPFGHWGADLYPFTIERIRQINSKLFQCPFSLEYLVGCTSSDIFSRLSGEPVEVSDLKNRYVGLYLYARGDSIDTVCKAHRRFKDKGFEVLVCPNPCYNEDPRLFQQFMKRALEKSGLEVSDWVVVPFKDSAARRRANLFPQEEDCLFILDPVEMVVDPHALDVIKAFGVDNFPFTRDPIIRTKVRKFRGLKLQSLFSQFRFYRNNDPSDIYSADDLGSGIVFVYFSQGDSGYFEAVKLFVQKLRTAGPKIKFEVVVVLWAPTTSFGKDVLSILSGESWLICPVDEKSGKPPGAMVELASEKIFFPRFGFLSFLDGELRSIASSGVGSVLEQHSPDERDEFVRLEVMQCMVDSGLEFMDLKDPKPFTLELEFDPGSR